MQNFKNLANLGTELRQIHLLESPVVEKYITSYPADGEEIGGYQLGDTEITVFQLPETVQYLYHMVPAEFKLSEEKYELLDAARRVLSEHQPKRSEFVDPERMRQVFSSVGADMLDEKKINKTELVSMLKGLAAENLLSQKDASEFTDYVRNLGR